MQLIKLDATESTNLFLKDLTLSKELCDFTVVSCNNQTGGRGQMGTSWVVESGKNLTFSVLKGFEGFLATHQFKISIAVSLALHDLLLQNNIPGISIKWPNDIMAGNHKICGILIENILKGTYIQKAIIGIGLNVNQTYFKDLPHATSMKKISNRHFDLDKLLTEFIGILQHRIFMINDDSNHQEYERLLFKNQIPTKFEDSNGNQFEGVIQGVEPNGLLKLKTEQGQLKKYGFKEIKMLY